MFLVSISERRPMGIRKSSLAYLRERDSVAVSTSRMFNPSSSRRLRKRSPAVIRLKSIIPPPSEQFLILEPRHREKTFLVGIRNKTLRKHRPRAYSRPPP